MQADKIPYAFMFILGLVAGVGLLLAKVDSRSVDVASRIVPWARLYRHKLFRVFAALLCFGVALLSLALWVGWIGGE